MQFNSALYICIYKSRGPDNIIKSFELRLCQCFVIVKSLGLSEWDFRFDGGVMTLIINWK